MKILFILLFVPLYSLCQTVHVKDDRIFYEGKEKIEGITSSEIMSRLQQAIQTAETNYKKAETTDGMLKAEGQFRLKTAHQLIRTVTYLLTIKPTNDGYEYTVDSVSMTEKKRGISTTKKPSKEILERMEDYGKEAENTERILNEIDLRIQHMLVLLRKTAAGDNTVSL